MRETCALILLLCAWHVQAATVTNDVVTMTLCSDGLYYSTPTCPNPALTGSQRFVRNGGSNAANGLTDATAWASLSKCTSLPTGTDCNLKSGSTWSERMTINWPGTDSDYAVVRCYKMSGANPVECASTDTKPILLGGMDQTKLTNNTEDYRLSKYSAEGIGNHYAAQYSISNTADYTEHKFLSIKNSRGRGVNVQGTGSSGSLHHVKIYGVDTLNTGSSPIVIENGVSDLYVKNGSFTYYNTCEQQRATTGINTDECNDPGWDGGLTIVRSVKRVLIEGNRIGHGLGEGMNCYGTNGSFSIYRGNTIGPVHSGGMYNDICTDSVVEGNIFVGSRGNNGYMNSGSAAQWGGGLGAGWEAFNLPSHSYNTERTYWRNNLIVGPGACFAPQGENAAHVQGRKVKVEVYGNTCIDPVNEGTTSADVSAASAVTVNFTNNVFWSDRPAAEICKIPASAVDETMLDNHWSTAPSDAECVGSGDTSGAPGLTVSNYATWEGYSASSLPTFANAAPTAGAIKDTGTCLTASMLTTASYGFAADNISAVLAGTITLANWGLQNAYDANNTARGATCSKGAVE